MMYTQDKEMFLFAYKPPNIICFDCVNAPTVDEASTSNLYTNRNFMFSSEIYIVTYSGVLFTMELYCTPKGQYTTVKHSRQLFEHTYTSDPHGLGTLAPIEFFQHGLLWESSNTHSHCCSQKASKHTSGQSIVGLSVHLHTTTAPRRIVHH
jgi:hypothetical protein